MQIAIALVIQDHFGPTGNFERRDWMIKRIPEHTSGSWGLPGFEIKPEITRKDIPMLLKKAIDEEKTGIFLVDRPKFIKTLHHDGDTVYVYLVNFVGQQPQRNMANREEAVIFSDLDSYGLTDLAKIIIEMAPKPKYQQVDLVRTRAF